MVFYSLRQGTLEFIIDMIRGISYRKYGAQNEGDYVIASSNVGFSSDFVDVWHTIQTKEEQQLFHDFKKIYKNE
jgi:hypothetical protein